MRGDTKIKGSNLSGPSVTITYSVPELNKSSQKMLSNKKAVFAAQSNKSFLSVRLVSVVLINLSSKTCFDIISMVLFNGTLVKGDTTSKETKR